MTLPQLPTDSLYKFMFLSGITIMGACSFFYVEKYTEISKSLDSIDIDISNSELAFYKDSINIDFEIGMIEKLQKKDSADVSILEQSASNKNKINPLNMRL